MRTRHRLGGPSTVQAALGALLRDDVIARDRERYVVVDSLVRLRLPVYHLRDFASADAADSDSLTRGSRFMGDLAERYGYVNRSLPDAELDEFVDSLANRIASFDKRVISETKRFVDVASLPPDYEIAPEWDVCFASIMRAPAQERIKKLIEQGFHKPGDVENRLGYYVGQVGR